MDETVTENRPKSGWLGYALAGLAVLAFGLVLARTAWICDDAYITLRTADNFVQGYGLRWNVNERVQAFTHPLWLAVLTLPYFFTREGFLTPIFTSMFMSMTAMAALAFGLARSWRAALLAVVALTCSRAFVDYSTAGLENPLTHGLLAAFLILYFRPRHSPRALFVLSMLAALGVLNRMDSALLFAPALMFAWLRNPSWKGLAAMALGGFPFAAWELFSIVYYGFPFPNTAYAKLGTGIASGDLAAQGLWYFGYTLHRDVVTLALLAAGALLPVLRRDGRASAAALGIVLYCLYIVRIGGDFMGGRFLTAPLFLAVALLSQITFARRSWAWLGALAMLAILSVSQPGPPFLTGPDYGRNARNFKDAHGVGDERMFYFQVAGLAQWTPGKELPTHSYAKGGREYRKMDQEMTKVHGSIGFRGFFAGPKVHIIDYYALSDPLLARLPAKYGPNWRIGHFLREVPAGYEKSAGPGINAFTDANLGTFYERLVRINRGPLWNTDRWRDIWNMNRGAYDCLIDIDKYRFADMKRTRLAEINPAASALPGRKSNRTTVPIGGLEVDLGGLQHAPKVRLELDGTDRYRIVFMRGASILGRVEAGPSKNSATGFAQYAAAAPKTAVEGGYTALRVFPYAGDKQYSLGALDLE